MTSYTVETAHAPQPPVDGQPPWGLGNGRGPSHLPPPLCQHGHRLLGLRVSASQLPKAPAAPTPGSPGGLAGTAVPGSWGFGCSAGGSPSRSTAGARPRRVTYLDSFGQPSCFPACSGTLPAAGGGRGSARERVLQPQPQVGEPRCPGAAGGRPGRAARPGSLGGGAWVPGGQGAGAGAPARPPPWGRRAPASPPSAGAGAGRTHKLGKVGTRAWKPCAARTVAVGPPVGPGCWAGYSGGPGRAWGEERPAQAHTKAGRERERNPSETRLHRESNRKKHACRQVTGTPSGQRNARAQPDTGNLATVWETLGQGRS